jgi:hypothetical protein
MTTAAKSTGRNSAKKAAKTPAAPRRTSTPSRTKAQASKAAGKTAAPRSRASTDQTRTASSGHHAHDVTVTIPVERAVETAAKAVALPIATAQRVLPAKGGLPLYLGLGALGIAGVLEWPIAIGVGVGYAVLRGGGALDPHSSAAKP